MPSPSLVTSLAGKFSVFIEKLDETSIRIEISQVIYECDEFKLTAKFFEIAELVPENRELIFEILLLYHLKQKVRRP
jgi:hypothetical protein